MNNKLVLLEVIKIKINNEKSYILMIFIGLIIFFLETSMLYKSIEFKKNAETTTGYLINYSKSYSKDSDNAMWSGIYEFKIDSQTYICKSSFSTFSKKLIRNEAKIDYDKSNPSINRLSSDIIGPILGMLFGLAYSSATIIIVFVSKKRIRRLKNYNL